MTHTALKLILTLLCFTNTWTACNIQKPIYSTDQADKPSVQKISIVDLVKNYKQFHGRYVETVGIFHRNIEEFALYSDTNWRTGQKTAFWIEIDEKLEEHFLEFQAMDSKRVMIKGIVDTFSKGHLGQYLATIKDVYYWQEQAK